MKENIIGREREIKELNNLYNSGKAELIALYGRRRVGKTFLVDEVLEGKITFRHAGLSPIEREQEDNKNENVKVCKSQMKLQLKKFYNDEFTVDKTYHKKLINRQNILERQLPKNSVVHPTLITTEGLKYNEYSGIFQKVVTLDDLFRREE